MEPLQQVLFSFGLFKAMKSLHTSGVSHVKAGMQANSKQSVLKE
jgi:hypothetical protein